MKSLDNLPSNSEQSKAGVKESSPTIAKVESVVTASGVKKKGFWKSLFTPEDGENLWGYLKDDVIIPGVKNGLSDLFYGVADSMSTVIFKRGSSSAGRRTGNRHQSGPRSYNNMYNQPTTRILGQSTSYSRHQQPEATTSLSYKPTGFEELTYTTRADAQRVIRDMEIVLIDYPFVTVSNYYEFSNYTTSKWNAGDFGWNNLDGVNAVSYGNKYIIDFKEAPRHIDNL